MTTVLLADDQAMIRSALATLLSMERDIEVVAQAGTCSSAVERAREHRPEVAVLDVQMPAGDDPSLTDGIAATRALRTASPQTRVIIVTTFGRPGYLRRAMEAGAVGFMVKDAPGERLVDGIRRVVAGLVVCVVFILHLPWWGQWTLVRTGQDFPADSNGNPWGLLMNNSYGLMALVCLGLLTWAMRSTRREPAACGPADGAGRSAAR